MQFLCSRSKSFLDTPFFFHSGISTDGAIPNLEFEENKFNKGINQKFQRSLRKIFG